MSRQRVLVTAALLTGFCFLNQVPCSAESYAPIGNYRLSTQAGEKITIEAEVIANFNNEEVFVRQPGQLMVVRIGEKFWSLGLRPGDSVRITGTLDTRPIEQNALNAEEVEVLRRSSADLPALPLRTLGELAVTLKPGDPAVAVVRLEDVGQQRVRLVDDTGSITFDRGPRWSESIRPEEKKAYVAIGVAEQDFRGTSLRGVSLRPVESFFRPGMGMRTRSIASILKEKPVGEMVRARGSIVSFIGRQQVPILIDGEDVLIVRLDSQHAALDSRIGKLSEVVGIYTEETVDGKTYGALVHAKVLPVKPRKPRIAGIAIPGF